MKKVYLLLLAVLIAFTSYAQEEISIKVGGFVRYEAYYDTYNSVVSRDGMLYLYPKQASLDANNKDINDFGTLNMLSHMSRFNIKAGGGPSILGAKANAVIEADFFGTGQDYVRLLRLRHAYVNLNWEKKSLLMGHSWAPIFVKECFPGVQTLAVGVPFHPLMRASQIQGTLKPTESLALTGALLMHTYHKAPGPINAQRQSGLPDVQLQFRFSPGDLLIGGTFGYKTLQPRTTTDNGLVTDMSIGSMTLQGFLKYSTENFSFKAMTIYGENLSYVVSIGGYGAAQDPTAVDDYTLSNMQTMTAWTDITFLKNPQIGVFVGYAENLGANGDYIPIKGYGRSENMAKTYRISPRVVYKVSNVTFAFEVLHATAIYGNAFDASYKATSFDDPTQAMRFIFNTKYTF